MAGGKWKIVEKNGICDNVNYRGAIKIQKTRNGERVRRSWSEKEEYNVETTEGKIPYWRLGNVEWGMTKRKCCAENVQWKRLN